ncbi:MAG: FKBP-type peptidyl-prolyl cis-trans isomerase [Nocardioidaceae bacterium]|nr:FKBP-type peptidyl-prolyl cis-trans isomerase [Nocardioidaceae bacterium]
MRRMVLSMLACVLLLATGCGSDDSEGSAEDEPTESSDTGGEVFPGVEVSGALGEQPTVTIAEPPFSVDETTTEVLDEGDGDEVQQGDDALLQYLGVNGRTGKEFDSSWARGEDPVTFPLEPGGLIQGFLDGLVGQTYGSRVAVAIPPDAGYGAQGNPQAGIEPDDTLVFVVDLIEAAPEPLPEAEGEEQSAPRTLPELQTDREGIPTGFEATPQTPKTLDKLVAAAVIVGEGPEVEAGQTATAHYVAQIYPEGKVFGETWTEGTPQPFALQPGGLPEGIIEGLVGQTVGSRVIVAIPSDLAFGKQGQPPAIPPDSDLIFSFDILAVS